MSRLPKVKHSCSQFHCLNCSFRQNHLSNCASSDDEQGTLLENEQKKSHSSISSFIYDIPEVYKTGVCSKSNPAWLGFFCCLGGFTMVALVTAGGLIGFRDKTDCPTVPQLPYLLVIDCALVTIKVIEVCSKNFLALYRNMEWLVSWRRHPVFKYLFPVWAFLDVILDIAILGAVGVGVYWLFKANGNGSNCKDSLVMVSYVSLFGIVGVFAFLLFLVLVHSCGRLCCRKQSSGRWGRRRYRHSNPTHPYGAKDYYYGIHNHHHTHLHYDHSINHGDHLLNSNHDDHHDNHHDDHHHHHDNHDFHDDFGFSFNDSTDHTKVL